MPELISASLRRLTRSRWTMLAVLAVFGGLVVLGLAQPSWALLAGGLAIVAVSVATGEGPTLRERHRRSPAGRESPADPLDLVRAVVANLPDPLVLMDAGGGIVLQNARADDVLGRRQSGQHISTALRAPQVFEALRRAGETGETVVVDYTQPVPIERRFEAYVAPIRATGEGAPALLMVLRDLTRQERIERMRADFVAHASHELRTPLASLIGFVDTLQGPAREDEASRDRFLSIMRVEAGRMSRLIDDLLSLNRIELNAHMLPTEEVDINLVVGHVVGALTPLAEENSVRVGTNLRAEPLVVLGDYDELVQVFQNLIQNAIKYGGSGGRIEIVAKPSAIDMRGEPASGALVEVRDFGPGIAAEHIPRLTERFYRVDATDSRQKGGTGLGLAIVKHILNRHRGTLTIRSELSAGSTFTVSLPLAAEAARGDVAQIARNAVGSS